MSTETEYEMKPVTTEPQKPPRQDEIPVVCYELPPFDPRNPADFMKAGGFDLMKPSPLESFTGRFARKSERRRVRKLLVEAGQNVHAISWGQHPETGDKCIFAYLWAEGAAPPKPPQKPVAPPPRTRRTATSRRHAPRPESRKKP